MKKTFGNDSHLTYTSKMTIFIKLYIEYVIRKNI